MDGWMDGWIMDGWKDGYIICVAVFPDDGDLEKMSPRTMLSKPTTPSSTCPIEIFKALAPPKQTPWLDYTNQLHQAKADHKFHKAEDTEKCSASFNPVLSSFIIHCLRTPNSPRAESVLKLHTYQLILSLLYGFKRYKL